MAIFRNPSTDDALYYAAALRECESGVRRDGLWAIAIVQAAGNEQKVKPTYLGLLAKAIKQAELSALASTRGLASLPSGAGWFYQGPSGDVLGPYTGPAMRRLANKIVGSTLVRGPGVPEWTPLLQVRSLVR